MALNSYRDLLVWQKSMDLVELVYRPTTDYPKYEQYGLTSQIRRAAVSIPANIAEGRRRGTKKDFYRFLQMAYGSGAELETLVDISVRLKYGDPQNRSKVISILSETMKMLNGMLKALN